MPKKTTVPEAQNTIEQAAEQQQKTSRPEETRQKKSAAPKKPAEKPVKPVKKTAAKAAETDQKTEKKPEKKAEKKPAKKTADAAAAEKPAKKTVKETVKETVKKTENKTAGKKTVKEKEKKPAEAAAQEEKTILTEEAPVQAAETAVQQTEAETEEAPVQAAETAAQQAEAATEEAPAIPAVAEPAEQETAQETEAAETLAEEAPAQPAAPMPQPRRSVAFIGSECYPFVKTGGLGDVMYALPKALIGQNCDVKVILPRYKCIPWKYQEKMVYRGAFQMDLCADGRSFYVGVMEYVWDGVVYDFIDNEDFFGYGNPYTNLIDDIPRFCFFGKAALAALNYMNWIPDVIHCHDWQAGLVPVYLRTLFANTPLSSAKTVLTIHNLRFQGVYNIPTVKYWSNLPDYVFNKDALKQGYQDANMLKGGLDYADMITTVSGTYAGEIQTPFFGENLDAHLRYHAGKLRGIVNGIDVEQWNTATDTRLAAPYGFTDALEGKKKNKKALQEQLGLKQDDHMFVIGLISRLTNQKGLDLVNAILPAMMDGHTQVVVLGTGDQQYEDSFRYYESAYKGSVCSNIMYDEGRAHQIYAGADALLVPSLFEPCGLTQLIAMRYGTVPIVRETGGLKDTVEPYNQFTNLGNGFTFDRYEAGLLLDAINRAKTLYFTNRWCWDEMVQRDMSKDVSWDQSAQQYRALYLELKP
ncbi:MAG: glycogen synthase [Clostridia bacterium]|nr:glycogen synthase [Clostridia bacterium]